MHTRLLGLLAVLAWAGCVAEPDDDGDDLDRLVHDLLEAQTIVNGVACGDCYDDLPPESQQECDELAMHDQQCWIDAYHVDREASVRHLQCTVPAEQDYAACLEDDVVCGDSSTWKECAMPLYEEQEACGKLAHVVSEAIAACSDPD
jgi:hypothetical protein